MKATRIQGDTCFPKRARRPLQSIYPYILKASRKRTFGHWTGHSDDKLNHTDPTDTLIVESIVYSSQKLAQASFLTQILLRAASHCPSSYLKSAKPFFFFWNLPPRRRAPSKTHRGGSWQTFLLQAFSHCEYHSPLLSVACPQHVADADACWSLGHNHPTSAALPTKSLLESLI